MVWGRRRIVLDESETTCELWNAEPPVHQPHSQLYHLDPIGVGSPLVESLTGYVVRLASEHSVHPSALVRNQILPLLNRPSFSRDGHPVSTFWGQQSVPLNGLTATASSFVQALEQLTQRRDLSLLTMLPYKEVLSDRALLRRTKAWCSLCYEEWRETKQIIYDPLLWTLSVITACSKHRQPLQQYCPNPNCARMQYLLTTRGQSGYCAWCGRWLGNTSLSSHAQVTDEERTSQQQTGAMVGALLAATAGFPAELRKETLISSISVCVQTVAKGKPSVFARLLQVQPSTIWEWQHARKVPQLGMLVKISALLEVPLFNLLTATNVEIDVSVDHRKPLETTLPAKSRKRRRRKVTKKRLRSALEAVIQHPTDPPPSMREVAESLKYSASYLARVFPELCKKISARHTHYQTEKGVERHQRLCEEVQQAIQLLHAQGRYPSKRQVSKLLTAPGSFLEPEVYRTWKETIQQLGWQQ
jgi:transcriptional regulator with XRE-family HTH domain